MGQDIEASIETFVDIESDLQDVAGPGVATPALADAESGTVVGAERVNRDEVPDDYPVPIEGDRALALEVEVGMDTTAVLFLNWPDDGNSFDHVNWLLEATGVSFDAFADVYGEEVPLAVRDGFVVAGLEYGDGASPAAATPVERRSPTEAPSPPAEEPESDSMPDEEMDENATNQVGMIVVLSVVVTYLDYQIAFASGFAAANIVLWLGGAILLAGAVMSDAEWVTGTTGEQLAGWWGLAVPVVPPVAAPVFLYRHVRARRKASAENVDLGDVHRTDEDLGPVVSSHDGDQTRIVVHERGVCVQSLDADPAAGEGASFAFDEISSIENEPEQTTTGAHVRFDGIPGARNRLTVFYPDDADGDQAVAAEALRRQRRIWSALQAIDADPETYAAAGGVVAILTADAVHLVREEEADARIPLDRLGQVGLGLEGTYRTPYAYFEDTAGTAASERVEKVYCRQRQAEFETFVENVADLAGADADVEIDGTAP